MPIKQFDKVNLKVLRNDIDAAIKQVIDKHGIDLSIGSISFDAGRFTTRMTGQVKGFVSGVASPSFNPFEFHGFKVGDSFRFNTKVLTVVGYNPRKPKNCVDLVDQNGKKFGASIDMVKNKLK